MIDLSKLSPAPWIRQRRYSNGCEIVPRIHCPKDANRECGWIADLVGAPYLGYESTLVNAEFITLARNAFDVLVRRNWKVEPIYVGNAAMKNGGYAWDVSDEDGNGVGNATPYPDPFTALVETDKWYSENIEKRSG